MARTATNDTPEEVDTTQDDTVPEEVAYQELESEPEIDLDNLPEGWTCSQLGTTFDKPEYLFTHDGTKEDGTVGPGTSFRVNSLDNLSELLQFSGKIPVGHKLNPHPE